MLIFAGISLNILYSQCEDNELRYYSTFSVSLLFWFPLFKIFYVMDHL